LKIDVTEERLVRSVERGEWRSHGAEKRERARYERYAKATLGKGRRLTVSLSKRDFDAIQARALAEGVSCESLVSTVLHKYATRRLRENGEDEPRQSHLSQKEPRAAKGGVREPDTPREPMELIAPRLLNVRQAAKYLGCSFWTIRDYVLQGLIQVVHLPPLRARSGARQRESLRRVVIDRADLDKFVEMRKGSARD
jgi:predicted DNA binding CopG/RHH family protein